MSWCRLFSTLQEIRIKIKLGNTVNSSVARVYGNTIMKLVHQLFNCDWFRFLSALGFGLIIHDTYPTRSGTSGSVHVRQAGHAPRWGLVLYAVGVVCGVGIALNFSGSIQIGTWLVGVAITMTVSTALRLGHLKRW